MPDWPELAYWRQYLINHFHTPDVTSSALSRLLQDSQPNHQTIDLLINAVISPANQRPIREGLITARRTACLMSTPPPLRGGSILLLMGEAS
jgi:hypothetical protein